MKKLLIAEDDDNLRLLYKKEFTEYGYNVILTNNGRDTVKRVKKERPDVIVMDIRIPGIDGIEAMNEIKSFARDIPVILNTAYPMYQEDFATWSAAAYVVKSADLSILKNAIEEAFQSI